MKLERQHAILKLVRTRDIYTQGELSQALEEEGFNIAQATVSRDIREMRLTKVPAEMGLKYAAEPLPDEPSHPLKRMFRDGLVSVDFAGNIVVLHTISGMAMAVALALDGMSFEEVLGTVAGDDVVICVIRSAAQAEALAQKLTEK